MYTTYLFSNNNFFYQKNDRFSFNFKYARIAITIIFITLMCHSLYRTMIENCCIYLTKASKKSEFIKKKKNGKNYEY